MRRGDSKLAERILLVIGIVPIIWIALLVAPSIKGGLPLMLENLNDAFKLRGRSVYVRTA